MLSTAQPAARFLFFWEIVSRKERRRVSLCASISQRDTWITPFDCCPARSRPMLSSFRGDIIVLFSLSIRDPVVVESNVLSREWQPIPRDGVDNPARALHIHALEFHLSRPFGLCSRSNLTQSSILGNLWGK